MGGRITWLALGLITGIGALGVYLMLTHSHPHSRRRWWGMGVALAALAVCLIAVCFGTRIEWWPQRTFASFPPWLLFHALAGCSLFAALLTITSARTSHAVLWFALLLVSNAGLFALHGASFLAMATLLVNAAGLAVAWLLFARQIESRTGASRDRGSLEPGLACVAGALLAVMLLGTVRHALGWEVKRANTVAAKSELNAPQQSAWPRATEGDSTARRHSHAAVVGAALYGRWGVGLEISAVLILVTAVVTTLVVRGAPDLGRLPPEPDEPPRTS
jgi:NADH:ubiquinone oxidoreductase subunit 6 (subunit J)